MTFTLMDTHTGNIVGSHPTQDEALRAVADTVQRYGVDAAETLALGQFEAGQPGRLIAEGVELVGMLGADQVGAMHDASAAAQRTSTRARGGGTRFVTRDASGRIVATAYTSQKRRRAPKTPHPETQASSSEGERSA